MLIDHFPHSDELGADTSHIHTQSIQRNVAQRPGLCLEEITRKISEHHQFLSAGGAGGFWTTFLLKGWVYGLYNGVETEKGMQASFEQLHLTTQHNLSKVELPFSNFCCVYASKVNFQNANLSHCLFVDAFLEEVDFKGAILVNSDFSRANLCNANFDHADCSGVDFENCNLEGASFVNTILRGARFPGANLKNVNY